MDKRERLQAAINGEPVDRVPVALWRHFPVDDQYTDTMAAAALQFQQQYDWDFVKITPASSYCIRDWGVADQWNGHPHGTRDYLEPRYIQTPDDWGTLQPLDPGKGQLAEVVAGVGQIAAGLNGHTPLIQTIFSPIAQAKNLLGGDQLPIYIRRHPEALKAGLETITESTLRLIEALRAHKVDGIFYAIQWASYAHLAEAEYAEFGEPYDRRILEAASDLWLNLVHLHGDHVMFERVAHYPAAILNWHDRETGPDLASGQQQWRGAVCGGLKQEATVMSGTPEQIEAEAREAFEQTGGRRFILGTGCVSPVVTPRANFQAVRDVAETLRPGG